jgi:hypothetical protein
MAVVLGYLRGLGVVPAVELRALSVAGELLEQCRRYLTVERGLTAGTARGYVDIVRPFVESRVTLDRCGRLWELSPADVLGFLLAETGRRSRKSAKLLVSALRSLLGFWHVQGLIGRPLAGAVPSVAGWRLAIRALHAPRIAASWVPSVTPARHMGGPVDGSTPALRNEAEHGPRRSASEESGSRHIASTGWSPA